MYEKINKYIFSKSIFKLFISNYVTVYFVSNITFILLIITSLHNLPIYDQQSMF